MRTRRHAQPSRHGRASRWPGRARRARARALGEARRCAGDAARRARPAPRRRGAARQIEALAPNAYDAMSYYERWMAAIGNGLLARGVVTADEIARAIAGRGRGAPCGRARRARPRRARPRARPRSPAPSEAAGRGRRALGLLPGDGGRGARAADREGHPHRRRRPRAWSSAWMRAGPQSAPGSSPRPGSIPPTRRGSWQTAGGRRDLGIDMGRDPAGGRREHARAAQPRRLHALLLLSAGPGHPARLVQEPRLSLARRARAARRVARVRHRPSPTTSRCASMIRPPTCAISCCRSGRREPTDGARNARRPRHPRQHDRRLARQRARVSIFRATVRPSTSPLRGFAQDEEPWVKLKEKSSS